MPPRPTHRRDDSEDEGPRGMSAQDLASAAAHVVRLALFHEHRRQPLRRDMISKLVLPNAQRQFHVVFERAQSLLRSTFGMEMHELRAKQRGDEALMQETQATQAQTQQTQRKKRLRPVQEEGDEEDDEEEEAEGSTSTQRQKEKKVAGTRSYILRSVLPGPLIAEMNRPAPLPSFEGDRGNANAVADSESDAGALLRWDKADPTPAGHIALLGIRTVILCLILAQGRVIEERALYAFLRRLNLERHTVLPWKSPNSHSATITLEQFMDVLAKQNYLEKTKHKHAGGDGPAEEIEWRWGSREAEFSEKAAAAFIEKLFLGDSDDESDSEEEEAGPSRQRNGDHQSPSERRAARRAAKRKRIHNDLERAAGGPLTGEL
ncbi:hypothetical protein CcaverHIS002_0601070 [Cutaneotrichosporon cavernicola]|uniref:MAGE domain-containing protein n=1 Tax=Cutaneotrichosporon cavernicola TaxID=279322 RepID=A0AA48QWI1_9TREE|nr:uncharacterized protein CcaverHIS019_0501170 [Cutaneotrichosporon cavernicola]BEI85820.1 hypothetical protein CcaverHIS002_0601070 [Cutaneotrichosporon cavernicola]BEI92489.1 hypothetical protein CcaverHIS019_0501170 [Cutaneotrichosporon cavernicola]BEJ00261.1 hypothetical protein CcaverHIS631_0501180 [Cutaneotrichosporon cavernicola]BEJ08031.1 hypothetical protein CcaverHIS641_0501160 [Cutaneotrichosporon cavernicola]